MHPSACGLTTGILRKHVDMMVASIAESEGVCVGVCGENDMSVGGTDKFGIGASSGYT